MLAGEIRMAQRLRLVEHVFTEDPVVKSRGGDRTHVMEGSRANRPRETHRVPRALDIGRGLHRRVGGEIVNRGEMEEMVDAAFQFLHVFCGKSEIGAQQVALDRERAVGVAPKFVQRRNPIRRHVAHEIIDADVAPLQQGAHQPFANKAARSCDEISRSHCLPPMPCLQVETTSCD